MTRNERRKLVKNLAKSEPNKYSLYKYMLTIYIDEEKTRKYTKKEAAEWIKELTEDEARIIYEKSTT